MPEENPVHAYLISPTSEYRVLRDNLYQRISINKLERAMDLELDKHSIPFDLESTLRCGQLFRWEKQDDWWYGVVEDRVIRTRQKDHILEFEGAPCNFISHYFRFQDNLPKIINKIQRDPFITLAAQTFPGLRLVRQDPWECLISYICATYKNIPAIKKMIHELSKRFGDQLTVDNQNYYTFPKPKELAKSTINELRMCKLGFRAKRVKQAAVIVDSNQLDFEKLKITDYKKARNELTQLPGVGNKVADCILLFSLDKLEAFPIDLWMKRVIQQKYANHFERSFIKTISARKSLSQNEYDKISSFAQNYFGEYAGYAQEYLFHFFRWQAHRID